MLHTLRTATATWVAKIFIGILIAGFALWGADDFLRVSPDSTVISVGDLEISGSEFYRNYQRNVAAAGRRLRQTLTPEQAMALGIVQQTLQQIVTRSLYSEAVRELGLTATDAQIAKTIETDPNFKDSLGKFSRSQFELLLANNGLSEASYVSILRGDERRGQLLDSVTVGARQQKAMVNAFYGYQGEKRIVETLSIPYASVKISSAPSQSDIEKYYKDHKARYMAPEFRKLTHITIRPEDLIRQIAVSEEIVKKSFEDRRGEFTKPELRQIQQMLFAKQSEAEKAEKQLKEGKTFLAVAKDLAKQSAKDVALGTLAKNKFLVLQTARDAVFALKANSFTGPTKTAFGWALFRVGKITAGKTPTYADLKKRLTRDLKLNLAGDQMIKLSRKIEDALAAGDKLERIARTFNLEIATIAAVDRRGRGRNGKAIKDPPKVTGALAHGFKINIGDEATLEESNDSNYFLLRVDAIVKPAPRALRDVSGDIRKSILADKRKISANKTARELAKKIAAGEKLAQISRSAGWIYNKFKGLNRSQMSSKAAIGTGLRDKIFAASKDSVVEGENRGLSAATVVRILEIETANNAKGKDLKKRMSDAITQSIANDITEQFRRALEQEHKTEINQAVLKSVLATSRNN